MESIINITSINQLDDLANQSIPVIVDFYTDWCGPCQALLPNYIKAHEEYCDRVIFSKVNIVEHPEIAVKFQVRTVPTLRIYRLGECVGSRSGALKLQELREWLNELKHL